MVNVPVSSDGLAEASFGTRSGASWDRIKRLATVALLAAVVMAGLGMIHPAPASAGQAGTINADGVSLLAGLDDHTVIGTMYAGERVDIFWGPESGLYQIRYYGTVGWVWAEFLSPDGEGSSGGGGGQGGATAPLPSSGSAAWVNTDSLNVRADASTSAAIWDSFDNGTQVDVIGDGVNGFVPISYYGSTAWVAADFLSWDGAGAAPAAAAPEVEHWIDVNRTTGLVTLFKGDTAVAQYWGSMGYDRSDSGFYSTAVGSFRVYRVHQPLHYTDYADAYITDWVGFDPERFNGFHSWTRDANGNVLPNGAGLTAGCVGLEPSAARAVYDFSYVGMRVEVHN
ncbi:MAG: SH3 domain-containing protein [Chloroflexota bacterium]|nr:SH3 domain-containing protein [Chloroflexota bacterium]